MKIRLSLLLTLLIFTFFNTSVFADSDKHLFVNLTTDDIDRAAMAVGISKKVLSTKKISATIFLSAQGVRWADKNIPQNIHSSGKTVPQMFQEFINSGGQVIICQMCMKNVGGIKKNELIDGIKTGGAIEALFADNTTVLTY